MPLNITSMATGLFMAAMAFAVAGLSSAGASVQRYSVLYSFCNDTNCVDGEDAQGGLVQDVAGNLYGTTQYGGAYDLGTVYELSPTAKGWRHHVLHSFCQDSERRCAAGGYPQGSLIVDAKGNLYGTTESGSSNYPNGAVFELIPDSSRTKWTLKTLYSFCSVANCADGSHPTAGLAYAGQAQGQPYDGTSPLFSTAAEDGADNGGVVFELNPAGGSWTETVLHDFCSEPNCADGEFPLAGVTIDRRNRIVGLTSEGGTSSENAGVAFRLERRRYNERVLYDFCSAFNCADGLQPFDVPAFDGEGNLYGTTAYGGTGQNCSDQSPCGVLFRISGDGTEALLHTFCTKQPSCRDGLNPYAGVVTTASGELYGTTMYGGAHQDGGVIYEYDRTYSVLYNFCKRADCRDGSSPAAPLILGQDGALYGTTFGGGKRDRGVVYRFLPPVQRRSH